MKDIAFLDTDFFNKTLKVTNLEGDSLLEKTLSLNYDFYICQKVFKELRKQSLSKAKELIDLGKIKLYKFEDCLKNLYAKNKTIAFIQFLLDLEFIIENMFATNQLYLEKFQHLESLCSNNNITVSEFSQEFERALNSIPSKSSIGEIATILMIRCLIRLNNVRIFSFMSDDKDARGCAYDTEESIFSYNCDSLFILLKQNGVKKDEARQFAKCWKNIHGERTIKYNDKERNKGIDFFNFIDDVYADKFVISRNGLPKIK